MTSLISPTNCYTGTLRGESRGNIGQRIPEVYRTLAHTRYTQSRYLLNGVTLCGKLHNGVFAAWTGEPKRE